MKRNPEAVGGVDGSSEETLREASGTALMTTSAPASESEPAALPEQESEPKTPEDKAKAPAQALVFELLDWGKYFLLALILGLFLMGYVVQRNEVKGVSMAPTLLDGDRLWVEKVSRLWNGYRRGEIVTVHGAALTDGSLREDDLVKRVVAIPGDRLRIADGELYLNEQKLDEAYLPRGLKTNLPNARELDVTLADGQYFVLGDNRESSRDSRYFGPIDESAIMGVVWFRSSPLERWGLVD